VIPVFVGTALVICANLFNTSRADQLCSAFPLTLIGVVLILTERTRFEDNGERRNFWVQDRPPMQLGYSDVFGWPVADDATARPRLNARVSQDRKP
jgi:hypothetical protein